MRNNNELELENEFNKDEFKLPKIRAVFEDPNAGSLVIKWEDGTCTRSKVADSDAYDFNTGLSLCFMKKLTYNFDEFCDSIHTRKTIRTDREGKLIQQLGNLRKEIDKKETEQSTLEKKYYRLLNKYNDLKKENNDNIN